MESVDFIKGNKVFPHTGEIASLTLSLMGPEEVDALSHVDVISSESFHQGRPVDQGIYDDHMGTTLESIYCTTCRNGNNWCPGHHGKYKLTTPVPSPLPMAFISRWLKIVCWTCGQLLSQKIPPGRIDPYNLMAFYLKYSKNVTKCPHCDADVWTVKSKKPDYPLAFVKINSTSSTKKKKGKGSFTYNLEGFESLSYIEIADILDRITNETVIKVGMPVKSHPRKLMIRDILVVATSVRPEIRSPDKRMRSNDITSIYKLMVEQNEGIPRPLPPPDQMNDNVENYIYLLAMAIDTLIKGSSGGAKTKGGGVQLSSNTNRDFMGLGSRFPQKFGQWRRDLFGKRAHKIFRGVITGDNNIPVGWVGVPIETARTIQIFEEVRFYNESNMTKILKNGTSAYPGCSMIIRRDTGRICGVDGLPPNYKLVYGDILLRDLVDGDFMNYNRQPTLSFSSIAGYRVMVLREGNTIRMNASACKWHSADFDGDCMIGIISQDVQPIIEIEYLSSSRNFVVSYQTGIPVVGAFQDALIGTALMTSAKNPLVIQSKAMQLFANIDRLGVGNPTASWDFSKKSYSTRDLFSRILPGINLTGQAKFYNPKFAPYIKYHEDDIKVEIVNGQIMHGMLDAETIGQGAKNGIIHITHNEYGPEAALALIHSIDQMTVMYHLWNGFSISAGDIHNTPSIKEMIANNIAKIIAQSREITEKLHTRELRPPSGITLREFYEEQQFNILQHGDEFLYPALTNVDLYKNGLVMLMLTGSKGKMASNFVSLTGMVGRQDIGGAMPPANVGIGRTSPFFNNFDTDPQSMGFVTQSFFDGVNGITYLYAAQETRNALIAQALSTALAGAASRSAIKNFENQVMDPTRQCIKNTSIVQPLYGGTGLDPRRIETVKFLTVSISDADFERDFKATLDHVQPAFRNKQVGELLEAEFAVLGEDRREFRRIFMTVEEENVIKLIRFTDKHELPINIPRIIKNILYMGGTTSLANEKSKSTLNPVEAIKIVKELCDAMPYLYVNQRWETLRKYVPPHYKSATFASQIALRSYLCVRELLRQGITNEQLHLIIQQIRVTYKKALMDYGMCVGILAAQCFSEPFTQFVLDSKHRSGAGGGTKTSSIVRVSEILKAIQTKDMKNPTMRIFVHKAIEQNEDRVRHIANHIEMVSTDDVVSEAQVFFEKIGESVHPRFKHENTWINNFRRIHSSQRARNLINYCIRLQLDREKMVLKSLRLQTIIISLQKAFPHLYQVHTAENEDKIIIRLYPTSGSLRKQSSKSTLDRVLEIMRDVREHLIRGINGIKAANLVSVLRTKINPETGAILPDLVRVYAIDTDGSNLEEVLNHPDVDPTRTQTDSVIELATMYGIECARAKIISELRNLIPSTHICHLSVYADEMTSTGTCTSIERSGTAKRDRMNITQRASFGAPLQVLTEAAVYNYTDHIHGVSGPLAMGTVPKVGSLYHDIVIDQDFISKFAEKAVSDLDAL